MSNFHLKKRNTVIIILGLLSALGPFSIDMYLPAFSSIASDLSVNENQVSYTLSSYFVGICLGQLFWGPILDRFGRKKPLLAGLLLYIIATLGCAMAHNLEQLIVLRFVQAIGACIGIVAPRAIIRDAFPVKEIAKIFSLMMLILSISPLLAPTVGSYVVSHVHWHYIFIILGLICILISFLVLFNLPETKGRDRQFSLMPKPIINSFEKVIKNRDFRVFTFSGSISSAGLYAYIAASPVIFMKIYQVSEIHYGWIFAAIATCLITCSQLNNFLLKKHHSEYIVLISISVQAAIGLFFVLGSYFNILGLYGTISCLLVYLGCQGFIYPNSSALSLTPFSKEAGSASALMGAIQMAFGAFSAYLVALFVTNSTIPLALILFACAFCAWLIVFFARKKS